MQELNLITNESIYKKKNYFCNNLEMKNIVDGLEKYYSINFFCRTSKEKKFHNMRSKKVIQCKNIISYLYSVYKKTKVRDSKYLIISITPYTFLSYIFLKILRKKIFIYIRSDGFYEYKKKLGVIGFLIYGIMFFFILLNKKIITNNKINLKNKKAELVEPCMLTKYWHERIKKTNFDSIKILYVGRLKPEKGIFSLIEIFKKIKDNFKLTIVGAEDNKFFDIGDDRISVIPIINNEKKLRNIYDKSNIFILPSFTEAYGMVIDEALSRHRPVIIFEEIKNIIGKRKGIFISKRNPESLVKTISYIAKNFTLIKKSLSKNSFSNKDIYINQLHKFLKYN